MNDITESRYILQKQNFRETHFLFRVKIYSEFLRKKLFELKIDQVFSPVFYKKDRIDYL